MNRPASTTSDGMRCPRCDSRYTQTLEMAYSQAARADGEGRISQFVASIAPPKKRSTVIVPLVCGVLSAAFAYVITVIACTEIDLSCLTSYDRFHWKLVLPAVTLGIAVAYLVGARAAAYNTRTFPGEYADWSRKAVCRRCATVFVPSLADPSDSGLPK